jgi:streptogramin lyase
MPPRCLALPVWTALSWLLLPGAAGAVGDLAVLSGSAVLRVEASTGDRWMLSGKLPFAGVARGPEGELVVTRLVDPAVLTIDPLTGQRRVLSGRSAGAGPPFAEAGSVAFDADGKLLFLGRESGTFGLCDNVPVGCPWAVFRVDLQTGDRVVLSGSELGSEVKLGGRGLAMAEDGRILVLGDGIVAVDPANGTRSVLSGRTPGGPAVGEGPDFKPLEALATVPEGGIFVADYWFESYPGSSEEYSRLFRVDPLTGDRTVLAEIDYGGITMDLAVDHDGNVFALKQSSLLRVDGQTGDVEPEASPYQGISLALDGEEFLLVLHSRIDEAGGLARVSGDGNPIMIAVDTIGSGPLLRNPRAMAVDAKGRLLVADEDLAAVFRIHPGSGDREIVSDENRGQGEPFELPRAIAIGLDQQIYVADFLLSAVFHVDPDSGDRTVVSGPDRGAGPDLFGATGLAVEEDGSVLVAKGALLRIAPGSGDRTVVSDASTGSGPLGSFFRISVRADREVLAADWGLEALVGIQPASGDRSVFSGDAVGAGPQLHQPTGIAIRPNGDVVIADGQALLRVNDATRNRVLPSGLHPTTYVVRGAGPLLGPAVPDVVFAPEPAIGLLQIACFAAVFVLRGARRRR